jgi:hypothetical protein
MAEPAKPAAPAAAPADVRSPEMKQRFQKILVEQKRLGWSDAQLCEFATKTVGPTDPYGRLKVTTVEFLSRLRPELLNQTLAALEKQR